MAAIAIPRLFLPATRRTGRIPARLTLLESYFSTLMYASSREKLLPMIRSASKTEQSSEH